MALILKRGAVRDEDGKLVPVPVAEPPPTP